jgi:hypothetical protein
MCNRSRVQGFRVKRFRGLGFTENLNHSFVNSDWSNAKASLIPACLAITKQKPQLNLLSI